MPHSLRPTRASALAATAAVMLAGRFPAPARAAEPLRIGATPADDFTPVIYARDAGLFAKAGLDVTIDKLTSGAATAAAVLSGTYDIGKSSIPTLLEAHEKGIPFTLIAPAAIYDTKAPYGGFVVSKDGPIHTGKDFNNQIVSVPALGDIGAISLMSWVDQHGGDSSTIKFVELPLAAGPAAVEQNRVAGAETGYPSLAVAYARGLVRLVPAFDGIAPAFMVTAWFTTKDFVAKRPEVVKAFARVCAAAGTYTNAHHDETAPMMATFTGIDPALIAHMTRTVSGTVLNASLIQPVIDVSYKYKALKSAFKAQELFDPSVATL